MEDILDNYAIDYVEIYTPMAKLLAYWHEQALKFTIEGSLNYTNTGNKVSYVLKSGAIRLVLTSVYPSFNQSKTDQDITDFISKNQSGVKKIFIKTSDVEKSYRWAINNGAIPLQPVTTITEKEGKITEASIKLYDENEIVFINRSGYRGYFRPGYQKLEPTTSETPLFSDIDHIASELRVNQIDFWSNYLTKTLGTNLVQSIKKSDQNKTGMVLNINQSKNGKITFVMAEPDAGTAKSKVQENINQFGPGIHHVAFSTNDIVSTIKTIEDSKVEFVKFPSIYYELLRKNQEMKDVDIDLLEKHGILIDKENDTFLYQKFVKPYGDRPFFFYEIVQRVNGYSGFALKNINVLKKAEELNIMSNNS